MKKIVLITSMCMLAGFSFAQKKAVKDAKSAIKNTAEARAFIKPALTHEETANDPETWKTAGDIEFAAFDKEREAEMLKGMSGKEGANEEAMYTGLFNLYAYYKKADELAQLPDEKGRIRNRVRKDINKTMKEVLPFFINGGVYYNDKGIQEESNEGISQNYLKSANFFEMYWDAPSLSFFEEESEPVVLQDSIYQTIKYYAVISAVQSRDNDKAVKSLNKIINSPYIPNSTHLESDPYELLSEQLKNNGDSIEYMESLETGANKFPRNKYFTPNLINEYIRAGQADKAINHLDQAVKNDPASRCELLSVKASLEITEKKYDEGIKNYQDVLEFDPNCERALEGLGVVYVLQAQDIVDMTVHETNKDKLKELDKQTVEYYIKSLPLLEKHLELLKNRSAEFDDIKPTLIKLQNVYYNLSLLNVDKDKELQEIEKQLNL